MLASASTTAVAPPTKLTLAGSGFSITSSGKPATTVEFTALRTKVVPLVSAVLGKPTMQGHYGDCGMNDADYSYVRFRGGFELVFDRAKLTGWTLAEGGDRRFRTVSGIGLGSTVAQLKRTYSDVELDPGDEANGGLGPSFQREGGPNGFIDGVKPTQRITQLYAGATCIAA